MKIFITGATGYVGGFILDELQKQGHTARCLVRSSRQAEVLSAPDVETVIGDVTDPESLHGVLEGCDAIIHLVAIIEEKQRKGITFERINYEGTQHMVDAAQAQNVPRFIFMSALGSHENAATPYYRTEGRAEAYVKHSGLTHTIFRPSFIYGPGDAVYTMLATMIRHIPFGWMPIFGDGSYRHQPVSVFNIAQGFVASLAKDNTHNRVYDVGGPRAIPYREQLEIVARIVGKPFRPIPVPMWLSKAGVSLAGGLPFSPIDRDRLAMLTKDNVCDPTPFSQDLNINLETFEKGLDYLKSK